MNAYDQGLNVRQASVGKAKKLSKNIYFYGKSLYKLRNILAGRFKFLCKSGLFNLLLFLASYKWFLTLAQAKKKVKCENSNEAAWAARKYRGHRVILWMGSKRQALFRYLRETL
jgi:hypothetical protein